MNEPTKTTDSGWKNIFKVGGIAGIAGGIITAIEIAVFVIWQPPAFSDTAAWFRLFQKSWLIGLLDLDALGIVCLIVLIPTVLAFYMALRRNSPSFVAFGAILFFIGTTINLASHPAFPMLLASGHYANAATAADQSTFYTVGTTILTIFESTTWGLSFILLSSGLLMISFVMLQSDIFTKKMAYLGISANAAGIFGFIPYAGLFFMFLNPVLLAIWLIVTGRKFYKLAIN